MRLSIYPGSGTGNKGRRIHFYEQETIKKQLKNNALERRVTGVAKRSPNSDTLIIV